MKKITFLIIMVFNIFPILKNNCISFFHTITINAQVTTMITPGTVFGNATQLQAYLYSLPNLSASDFRHNPCCSGTKVQSFNLNTGEIKYTYLYQNAATIAEGMGTTMPSTPQPLPQVQAPPDEYDQSDGESLYDLSEPPEIEPIDPSQLFPTSMSGGSEAPDPTIPTCENLYSIFLTTFSFSEGEAQSNMYPQSFINPPSLPCSNNFLLGSNIITFPPGIASSIGQYNFENNFINAIKLNNATNDVFNKMVRYDVLKTTTTIDANDPSFCTPVVGYKYTLLNQRGTYKFVCYSKLAYGVGTDVVGEISADESILVKEDLPADLPGVIFTLPPSSITPAQVGNSVLSVGAGNTLNCQPLDCAKVPNGTASIDNCGACRGGTTGVAPCSQTQSNTTYYTTLNNDTTKYYNNDTIYVPQRNANVKLTIHKKDGTIAPTDLVWKRLGQIDTTKCSNIIECFVTSNTLGVTVVRVDSTTQVLIKNPLAVYKVPTLYFKRGNNYDGEYGFDDSTHQYLNMRNETKFKKGYEVRAIMGDPNYFVPWLSLVHNKPAISIKDSLGNFSAWAKKDKNGYVEFKAQISNVTINSPKHYYTTFNSNSLSLSANEWCITQNNLRLNGVSDSLIRWVYAITNTGDTIGKLNISCAKLQRKKIQFIYVKIGTAGYDSSILSRVGMINKLSNHSHNQIFREWELVTPYSDTLDLNAEFLSNPQDFGYDSVDVITKKLKNFYLAHKGINLSTINQTSNNGNATTNKWIRYAFILPVELRKDSITPGGVHIPLSWVNGEFNLGGTYGAFYKTASLRTVIHELGHSLNNNHTFPETDKYGTYHPNFLIPEKTTRNFMDYFMQGETTANMFFYAQWILTF
jgi:hypothetical protein